MAVTYSVLMRAKSKTVRFIRARTIFIARRSGCAPIIANTLFKGRLLQGGTCSGLGLSAVGLGL